MGRKRPLVYFPDCQLAVQVVEFADISQPFTPTRHDDMRRDRILQTQKMVPAAEARDA